MSANTYPRLYTYQITYLPTQQSYIGVRTGNNVLAADDFWHIYWTSSKKVKALIDEHGKDAFRIDWIREYETKEEAWAEEMILLKENDVVLNDHYLNQAIWPVCDNKGRKAAPFTAEHKKNMSIGQTGKKLTAEHKKKIGAGNAGKIHTAEYKKNLSEINKGKKHTDETRRKISEYQKGRPKTEETRKKMSDACKGRVFTDEHRRKLSEAHRGKTFTEEHKKNLRNAWVKRRIREQDEQ